MPCSCAPINAAVIAITSALLMSGVIFVRAEEIGNLPATPTPREVGYTGKSGPTSPTEVPAPPKSQEQRLAELARDLTERERRLADETDKSQLRRTEREIEAYLGTRRLNQMRRN